MGLSRFFIDRPVFAWVLAIVIMLAGGIAAFSLPVAQYPTIAPPAVVVSTFYPGADATTLQNSVTQVIEQQLTGLDNLLYFSSASNADGSVSITATFAAGTNPDIAQVQGAEQGAAAAIPQLPAQVQQQGITVQKSLPNFILIVAVYDISNRYNNVDISDFITCVKMQDPLSRVTGVGNVQVFGAQYAMRIWMDPYKLHDYGLMPSGHLQRHQGAEHPGLGRFAGRPARRARPGTQRHRNRPVATADPGPVSSDIILKTDPSPAPWCGCAMSRASSWVRTPTPSKACSMARPAAGAAILLAPGANALKTVDAVKQRAEALRASLPPGMQLSYPIDNTNYIRLSIRQVVETLIEAVILVVLAVMYVFLQNWRTTLVPAYRRAGGALGHVLACWRPLAIRSTL